MTMIDRTLRWRRGKLTGLDVTKSAPLTLSFAAGTFSAFMDGLLNQTITADSYTFVPDAVHPTLFYAAIVWDGTNPPDLWVDTVLGKNKYARNLSRPTGYQRVLELAWGVIAANETDLSNPTSEVNRRVFV